MRESLGWETPFGPSMFEERERARQAAAPHLPLWVLPGASLHEQQLSTLRVIEEYDLTPVRNRLVGKGAMTPGWADEAIFEFRRYLGLRAVFPEPLSMLSPDVDNVWHTCILHTRLYAHLCERAFGRFLHHDPVTEPASDRRAAWDEFGSAYRSMYGELGPLWELGGR